MGKQRKKLESLRLSICHLAKKAGVKNPLIEGEVSDWMKRVKTVDSGWNLLVLDIMEMVEQSQDPHPYLIKDSEFHKNP